jgi:hypothetical protein
MARTAVWVLALCFNLITSVLSDCPDRSYRCRAALTENFIKVITKFHRLPQAPAT